MLGYKHLAMIDNMEEGQGGLYQISRKEMIHTFGLPRTAHSSFVV